MSDTDPSQQKDPLISIPKKRYGWLLVYGFFAFLGITAVVLSTLYRAVPKRSDVIKKRKATPTFSAYTLVLSPLDSALSLRISQEISKDIGGDSISTKMILNGTAFHKQCTSLTEYERLTKYALLNAKKPDVNIQSQLLDKVLNIMIVDTIFAQFYILGNFGNASIQDIEKTIIPIMDGMVLRSKALGKVKIILYLNGGNAETSEHFQNYLRESEFSIEIR